MSARSGKYIGKMIDPRNNQEARNSPTRLRIASSTQEPAIKKVFHTINHRDATAPAPVITAKLHIHLLFHQSKLSYGKGKKCAKGNQEQRKQARSKQNIGA